MHAWDWLIFTPDEFKPDSAKSADWSRRAFVVNGPGHCGACHTPKNFLGADQTSRALQGSQIQGWFAPNITGDKTRGVGSMSIEEVIALLKTRHNEVTGVGGPMGEEIADSSSHFTDADLKAVATYLQSVPGGDDGPTARSRNPIRRWWQGRRSTATAARPAIPSMAKALKDIARGV